MRTKPIGRCVTSTSRLRLCCHGMPHPTPSPPASQYYVCTCPASPPASPAPQLVDEIYSSIERLANEDAALWSSNIQVAEESEGARGGAGLHSSRLVQGTWRGDWKQCAWVREGVKAGTKKDVFHPMSPLHAPPAPLQVDRGRLQLLREFIPQRTEQLLGG